VNRGVHGVGGTSAGGGSSSLPSVKVLPWRVVVMHVADLLDMSESLLRALAHPNSASTTFLFVPGPRAQVKVAMKALGAAHDRALKLLKRYARSQTRRSVRISATATPLMQSPPTPMSGPGGFSGTAPVAPLPSASCCGAGGGCCCLQDPYGDGDVSVATMLPREWATPYCFLASVLADIKRASGVEVIMFNAPAW
jgi:hypothetical protein